MKKIFVLCIIVMCCSCDRYRDDMLENGFVYLSDIDNSIVQSVRYATEENFVGDVIDGYGIGKIINNKKRSSA